MKPAIILKTSVKQVTPSGALILPSFLTSLLVDQDFWFDFCYWNQNVLRREINQQDSFRV